MYGKKVKLRILFLFLAVALVILSVYLVLKSLEENVVYFLSPTEIKNLTEINSNKIRIGGMVKNKSVKIKPKKLTNTKKNWKKDIEKILLSIIWFLSLKFLIDTGIISIDKKNPKIKE